MTKLVREHWLSFASLTALLLAWELACRFGVVAPELFASPLGVLSSLQEVAMNGELWREALPSIGRVSVGLVLGGGLGILVGLATGRVPAVNRILSPIIQLLRPMPPVAIIPLVIVWLGVGEVAKIFSIAFGAFFPVWINTHLGSSQIPEAYLWAAKSLGLSRTETLYRVVLPAAVPFATAGVRAGVAVAFVMVFVSELAGASSGIGFAISTYSLAYRTDRMMAFLAVLVGLGAMADWLVAHITNWLFPWQRLKHP